MSDTTNDSTLPTEPTVGDFGQTIRLLKLGYKMRRRGWNGKGMWVAMTKGSEISTSLARAGAAQYRAEEIDHPGLTAVQTITILPHIDMRAADGSLVIGWLASQTDMLAEDWEVVG